ncbi:hypothetical protein L1049_012083 [Liquidambar formosana]|uniref:Uncharacterized protein n=1 Tax=Liquidambar formosana TaxID=63359 RepID=A0AAP0RTM7_LIQFO
MASSNSATTSKTSGSSYFSSLKSLTTSPISQFEYGTPTIYNVVLGCFSLFPIAGAILADSFLGSFTVITIFSFVSLLGVIMLVLIASLHSFRPPPCTTGSFTCETPSNLQYAVLYAALALAAIGLGGTRFTLATMGANQFDKADHRGIFFNWFFLSLYMANVISLTAIIYIQDNVSWAIGFGICIVANVIGLAVFLLGKRFYRHIKPEGSPFTSIARVIVASLRKRKMLGNFDSQDYYHGSSGTSKMPYRTPTESFRFLNSAALKTEPDKVSDGSYAKSWRLCTVEEVEDLKTLIKIIPVWSTGIFLYAPVGIFSSLTTLQALSMDRHLGPHFQIPAGSFLVFNQLATAISILIIDRFLIPTWQNVTRRSLTLLQRVGIGHIISIVGMVGSALVETRRLHVIRTHHLMSQSGSVVPMSALWLVMSLTIIGISEGFHFPGQVALYYQEFPTLLKSTSTAMVSLLIGIGFYLSTAIINLVRRITGWLPDNINDGRIDNVYWMLAVVGVVNFGYFLACAKLYEYQNVDKDDGPSGPSNSEILSSFGKRMETSELQYLEGKLYDQTTPKEEGAAWERDTTILPKRVMVVESFDTQLSN